MPTTKTGKWSARLIIAFLFFILVFNIIVSSGVPRDTFTLLDPRNLPMALALVCAVLSLGTGLIAIIRNKKRAVSVFISAATGFYFLFLVAGEFLFPH